MGTSQQYITRIRLRTIEMINRSYEDFQTNSVKIYKELWNDKDFADVTLVTVDDKQVRAHKVILSSYSSFFKSLFWKY